jgi:hypothetical protein
MLNPAMARPRDARLRHDGVSLIWSPPGSERNLARVVHRGGVSSMANLVNLNRYRKKRARDDRQKTAEANRVKHGRTKAEKRKERHEREREEAALDAKRHDDGPEPPEGD